MDLHTPVGYIGLGQMGSAMATHLASSGAAVVVCDLNPAATADAVAAGATAVATAAEVAATCDVVSICVPAAAHLAAVATGPGGLADGARPGTTLLVHSTVAPDTVRDLAATAGLWGVAVHDACVAGGADAAANGDLVVLAGGLAAMDPAARAVLDVYASRVIDGGPVGAGAALKLGVNVMTYAQFAAAACAFDLAAATGTDTASLVEAWRHTGQLGRLTEAFLPLLSIPSAHITGTFRDSLAGTVDIATKDLALAASLADARALGTVIDSLAAAMPTVFGIDTPPPHDPEQP
jgi:3-hydroxyisobutyrate dehydrogenase-like beta-hydroxyacid dehydrogenase